METEDDSRIRLRREVATLQAELDWLRQQLESPQRDPLPNASSLWHSIENEPQLKVKINKVIGTTAEELMSSSTEPCPSAPTAATGDAPSKRNVHTLHQLQLRDFSQKSKAACRKAFFVRDGRTFAHQQESFRAQVLHELRTSTRALSRVPTKNRTTIFSAIRKKLYRLRRTTWRSAPTSERQGDKLCTMKQFPPSKHELQSPPVRTCHKIKLRTTRAMITTATKETNPKKRPPRKVARIKRPLPYLPSKHLDPVGALRSDVRCSPFEAGIVSDRQSNVKWMKKTGHRSQTFERMHAEMQAKMSNNLNRAECRKWPATRETCSSAVAVASTIKSHGSAQVRDEALAGIVRNKLSSTQESNLPAFGTRPIQAAKKAGEVNDLERQLRGKGVFPRSPKCSAANTVMGSGWIGRYQDPTTPEEKVADFVPDALELYSAWDRMKPGTGQETNSPERASSKDLVAGVARSSAEGFDHVNLERTATSTQNRDTDESTKLNAEKGAPSIPARSSVQLSTQAGPSMRKASFLKQIRNVKLRRVGVQNKHEAATKSSEFRPLSQAKSPADFLDAIRQGVDLRHVKTSLRAKKKPAQQAASTLLAQIQAKKEQLLLRQLAHSAPDC